MKKTIQCSKIKSILKEHSTDAELAEVAGSQELNIRQLRYEYRNNGRFFALRAHVYRLKLKKILQACGLTDDEVMATLDDMSAFDKVYKRKCQKTTEK